MDFLLTFGIPGLVAIVILGVFFKMSMPKQDAASIEERLSQFAERPMSLEELELEQPFNERVIKPMVAAITGFASKLTPSQSAEKLRNQLVLAGNPYNMQATEFTALRLICAVILGGVFFVVGLFIMQLEGVQLIGVPLVGAFIGYLSPSFWLGRRIKARKKDIMKILPDAIDLMTISVEAGLAFDGAMQRVAEKWNNALSLEFQRAIAEMRVGKSKRDALREIVVRTGVPDLSTFVASVIQADQLGVSISKVLRIQSEQLRIRRRQRAEEQAHKAPILMMIPMVFLIFPATYIVILGPSVPKMIQAFGTG
ncbi:MAG: type II secretion system F family protein [Chloroflexia bacterium]